MGTDDLFENHSIKEIQDIEKKLRNDIEKKKEELRQMVGERYRDLMEAADTITEMKEIAESVTVCAKSIENGCILLENSSLKKGILCSIQERVNKKKKKSELLHTIASQIKILIDSPHKIWSFIQARDFISAVSLYLLSRQVHSLLSMNPAYREKNVSALFPIIGQQWTTINQFRQILLQNCQLVLEDPLTEPEEALSPLCCSCLLTNTSLHQTLLEILNIRKNILKSLFQPEKYAKSQICEFVNVVQMTLKIVFYLLYPENKSISNESHQTSLLNQKLTELVSMDSPGPVSMLDYQSSGIFKFLPSAIKEFRPMLTAKLELCSVDLLHSKCTEWLQDIKRDFQNEIRNQLKFVSSVQSLSLIREAVFKTMSEVKIWREICNCLLMNDFSIWDFFLKDCFIQRIEDIINERLKSASEMCQKNIEEALYKIGQENEKHHMQYEKNVSAYVWCDSSGDILDNMAWNPRHHRNHWSTGELSMKAMGFTPKIQSICKDLDCQLQAVLEDSSHFCYFNDTDSYQQDFPYSVQKIEINLAKDDHYIYKFISDGAEKNMFEMSNYIEATLSYLEQEILSYENSLRIVLLGHLCHGLANLCPHINSCLSSEKLHEVVERCKRQGVKINFASSYSKENDLWKNLKKKLQETSAVAFKLWNKYQISSVMSSLNDEFTISSPDGLLKSLLQWNKIEIQEESEEGKTLQSVLHIPQQLSTPIANALFAFCCELNTVGGFSINSEVRASMSKCLLLQLLEMYRSKVDVEVADLNPHLVQIQSLQVLFDVQFLVGLIVYKDSPEMTVLTNSVLSLATSRVDPFDMDVFNSPLQQNIKKALQKSLSLFGLVASPDQVSYLNMKSQFANSPMDPNIMLTSNSGSRFPLLPLPTRSSNVDQDQFIAEAKEGECLMPLQHSHSSSPNLSAFDIPTNTLKATASFYERVTAMSSSWFGN